jgi:NADH:ubiquinone oxidoreductase subunit 5 (subunit L)/multisubunit Na+/H+ antiporter MnhA subunit
LISLEENGIPRNYHRPEDVPAAIDASMVVRAGDFGAAIGAAWLRGEAGPLALL